VIVRILDRAIASTLPAVPKPVVRHIAARYIAGESLEAAVTTVRRLNTAGEMATIDVLGEFVRSHAEAEATVTEYERVLDAIATGELNANVSVKLSAVGIELDHDGAQANIERLVRSAAVSENFVRIDMEHSGLTSATLEVYRKLRAEGLDNCGVVIQSYLRRSLADVRALAQLSPNVRLVKGIYVEPRAIAYQDPGIVRRNFVELVEELVGMGSYVAVASHDPLVVDASLQVFERHGLQPEQYEFQMLLGVAEGLRRDLLADGQRVRVYVPYGDAWYSYAVRRLNENPSIAGHVARDLLRSPFNGRQ
jgi:proline dehydrogenase